MRDGVEKVKESLFAIIVFYVRSVKRENLDPVIGLGAVIKISFVVPVIRRNNAIFKFYLELETILPNNQTQNMIEQIDVDIIQ